MEKYTKKGTRYFCSISARQRTTGYQEALRSSLSRYKFCYWWSVEFCTVINLLKVKNSVEKQTKVSFKVYSCNICPLAANQTTVYAHLVEKVLKQWTVRCTYLWFCSLQSRLLWSKSWWIFCALIVLRV